MGVVLSGKYSQVMYFIGIFILLALFPLYIAAACQDSNCLVCNDISVCNVCNGGYYLEAGSCKQCPARCATCINSTHCQGCLGVQWYPPNSCNKVCYFGCTDAGCYEVTGYCYKCIPGVYGTICGCKIGYFNFDFIPGYTACLQCPPNCITCSHYRYCTHCERGYYRFYYRDSRFDKDTMICVQCGDQCTECTSIDQCPECPPECIKQGCGVSGCNTTTPTPTTIKLTSTSKEDISTTIKSQESTPPATTKTTVCPTECTSGCDTHGGCHETTTIYNESDGPSAASQNRVYHEGFGHGVATGIGVVIFIVALIGIACFLIRRTQCIETPCFAKTTTTSKEQHVYHNTQTEMGRTSSIPRNIPDYVNADNVPPGQDSEYEINETGEYSSLDERQLEHQYSDLQDRG